MMNMARGVLGLCLLGPALAWGCSCAPPLEPLQALEGSTQVFRGTVLSMKVPDNPGFPNRIALDFRVSEVWKGEALPLQRIHTPANSAACGRGFQIGIEYLVYTESSGDAILCSRTAPVASAAEDLEALGEGERPQPDELGVLARHAVVAGAWFRPEAPGEGVLIELIDEDRAALYWYGFSAAGSAEGGAQRWLFGVGRFRGPDLVVDTLEQLEGEGFAARFDPASVTSRTVGSVEMRFSGAARAVLRYRFNDDGAVPVELDLQRLTRPPVSTAPAPR